MRMNEIEFEDQNPIRDEDLTADDVGLSNDTNCPRCGFPLIEEDKGVCPRCGFRIVGIANHTIEDKRFPKWAKNTLVRPIKPLGLKIWQEILLVVVLFILAQVVAISGQAIFKAISEGTIITAEKEALYVALLNLILQILIIGAAALIMFPNLKHYFKSFFARNIAGRTLMKGALYAVVLMVVSTFLGMISNIILTSQGIEQLVNENQRTINALIQGKYWYIAMFVVCLLGPISEEIRYRIGLFSLLKRANRILAYVISAIIFGLIHFDFNVLFEISTNGMNPVIIELVNLPSYIVAGLILSFAYEDWGPGASTMAHILYNSFGFILNMIASRLPETEQALGMLKWIM